MAESYNNGDRIYLNWGYIEFSHNEISLISTVEDPPAVRLASMFGKSLGKVSGNRVRQDGVQEELVILQFKELDNDPGSMGGEFTIHVRKPDTGSVDDAQQLVMTGTAQGITFHVPIAFEKQVFVPSVVASPPSYMKSGKYEIHIQNIDGNFVVYDTSIPYPDAPGKPVWDSAGNVQDPYGKKRD